MPSLADRQEDFAAAILDPRRAVPTGVSAPPGSDVGERFAVYRNNVAVGLVEALRASFPVVDRLVGRDFFTAMARLHALQSPPRSPVLLEYGAEFAEFVAGFEPAAVLPYLADVARLEWLWLETYHAADATALPAEGLHSVPLAQLPFLRLDLHPSVRLACLEHPVLAVWQAHQPEGKPEPVELGDGPENLLFVRADTEVTVAAIPAAAMRFLEAVRAGGTIVAALDAAATEDPATDLGALLATLFGAGTFAGFAGPDQAKGNWRWS